jgi:hypothetical protein
MSYLRATKYQTEDSNNTSQRQLWMHRGRREGNVLFKKKKCSSQNDLASIIVLCMYTYSQDEVEGQLVSRGDK